MKLICTLSLALLLAVTSRAQLSTAKPKQQVQPAAANNGQPQKNVYPELRNTFLMITPAQLKLKFDTKSAVVYGVVMDWNIDRAVATIGALQNGDASIYVSTGQVLIGGFKYEQVRTAAWQLVKAGQAYLQKAKPAANTDLPQKGYVTFYLLTNKGRFSFTEQMDNITNKTSDWAGLFSMANAVLTAYRHVTEEQAAAK